MRLPLFLAAWALAVPAGAEIVSSNANGFHVRHQVTVSMAPAEAYAVMVDPKLWWHPDHTWSGSSDNFTLDARAGGCFCEALPNGGSAMHLQVWQVKPGEEITMAGGLGPLLYASATGTMHLKVAESEDGTTITMDYKVFGFQNGDGEMWSKAVDSVLGVQMQRLGNAASKHI